MTAPNNLPQFPQAPRPGGAVKKGAGAAALAALLGISVSTAVDISKDTQRHESSGRVILKAYPDSGHIWTICDGIIRWQSGQPVRPGDTATPEQCEDLRYDALIKHGRPLIQCLPELNGRDNQVRALIDLSYNAGVAGVCNGQVGQNVRAGHWAAAGRAILLYDRVTFPRPQPGKDCVKKKGPGWACRIRGLTNRRIENKARFDMNRPAEGVR
jgi:GH24 family phage-related lysozyme (muramidase)